MEATEWLTTKEACARLKYPDSMFSELKQKHPKLLASVRDNKHRDIWTAAQIEIVGQMLDGMLAPDEATELWRRTREWVIHEIYRRAGDPSRKPQKNPARA